MGALMDRLAALNPTADPASSSALVGTWDIVWTTESELLALTAGVEPLPVRLSSGCGDEDDESSYRSLGSSDHSASKAPRPAGRSPLQVIESVLAAVNKALASL